MSSIDRQLSCHRRRHHRRRNPDHIVTPSSSPFRSECQGRVDLRALTTVTHLLYRIKSIDASLVVCCSISSRNCSKYSVTTSVLPSTTAHGTTASTSSPPALSRKLSPARGSRGPGAFPASLGPLTKRQAIEPTPKNFSFWPTFLKILIVL